MSSNPKIAPFCCRAVPPGVFGGEHRPAEKEPLMVGHKGKKLPSPDQTGWMLLHATNANKWQAGVEKLFDLQRTIS
jgi:hypothetical protein